MNEVVWINKNNNQSIPVKLQMSFTRDIPAGS